MDPRQASIEVQSTCLPTMKVAWTGRRRKLRRETRGLIDSCPRGLLRLPRRALIQAAFQHHVSLATLEASQSSSVSGSGAQSFVGRTHKDLVLIKSARQESNFSVGTTLKFS